MKNKVQKGDTLLYTNGGETAIASGDVVPLANRIAVAAVDISAGKSGSVDVVGVFSLAKKAEAIDFGDDLHWDTVTKSLTKTASTDTVYAGLACESVLSGASHIKCRLQSGYFPVVTGE